MHKKTRGLIAVFSKPRDAARKDELRRWEDDQARKILGANIPGLLDIRRYEHRPWKIPKPEGFNWNQEDFDFMQSIAFVTLYETSLGDPTSVDTHIQSISNKPMEAGGEIIHRGLYRYQTELHAPDYDPNKEYETKGILVAMVHPRDDKRYEEWYTPTHLDDEARHGVNHSVTRFLNLTPGGRPKSFAVLETSWDDITEARHHINTKFMPNWRYPPGITEAFEVVAAPDLQRIFF